MLKRKNNLLEYCHGCLAKDRPLVSIDSLFHTFLKLMENKIDKIRIKANVPRMCWECRAALRNSEKFVLKAIKAQEFLAKYPARKVATESLSNLSTVLIDYYDTQETHEDYAVETKLESNDHFSQIDVDLKEENTSNDKNFADDYEDIKEDIKENIKEDLKVEIDIKSEPELTNEDNKLDIKVEKKKGKKSMKTKFKIITLADDDFDFSKAHKKVMIDDKERMYWSEKDRSAKNYRTMAYKCELCITGHATKRHYDKHMAAFHSESSGKFECDICKRRYKTKRTLREDIREHYMKYACLLCDYEHRRPWKVKSHLKTHKRVFMCLKCGLKFGFLHTFYEHYRRLHKRVICDYCGKRWSNKQFLIKHIKQRHDEPRCEICNRTYASFESLTSHNRLHHEVVRTEESYCVECDVQFDNVARYMVHVKTSVKHKKYPGVPCPVCNKVYHKKYSMTNHYRHEHLKKTPYYCEECSRYFLHSYRLRIHKEKIHDKIQAPKDKMCPHCGRGFSTNRVLINHIRTHTGERPFECDVCSSKFTQKSALTVHRRSVHKIK